jgi:phosphoserine phosphatase
MSHPRPLPLVVDLDGTLLPITTRWIMEARLAFRDLRALSRYRSIYRRDRHAAKFYLWDRIGIDLDRVVLRPDLLRRMEREAAGGREIYIASGAPDALVQALVERLESVAHGWGSHPEVRLTGPVKAELLVERFGQGGFTYIGDAWEDLAVWAQAHTAVVCWPSRDLRHAARQVAHRVEVLPRPPGASFILAAQFTATTLRQVPWRRERRGVEVSTTATR